LNLQVEPWFLKNIAKKIKVPLCGCQFNLFLHALQIHVNYCYCAFACNVRYVMTEWKPEHFSDVAVLLSKCEDVESADVPSSVQV